MIANLLIYRFLSFIFFTTICTSIYADVKTNINPQDYINKTHTITMIKMVHFAGEIQPYIFFDDGSEWLLSEFSYQPWNWNIGDSVSVIYNYNFYLFNLDDPYAKFERIEFYTIPDDGLEFSIEDWKP